MDEFEVLARLQVLQAHLRNTEFTTIKSLRAQGYSLPKIAEAMELSRQALRKRLMTGYYGEVLDTKRP